MDLNLYEVCIAVGLLAGLLQFFRARPAILKVIMFILCGCLFLGYFTDLPIKSWVFLIFGIGILGFSIWSLLRKEWLTFCIALFALLSTLWILFNLAYYNYLQLLMILPLLCFAWTVFKWKRFKEPLPVLTLLASYELSELIRLITSWNS